MQAQYEALLLEDDEIFIEKIQRALWNSLKFSVVRTVRETREKVRNGRFDIILLDKRLPDGLGTSLIPEIKMLMPHAVILVLTADKLDETLVDDLAAGASDYLHKTETISSDLMGRIMVALGRLKLEKRCQKAETVASQLLQPNLVGRSNVIQELRTLIQTFAKSPVSILVTGETGTGKELVARALNLSCADSTRAFIALNCGAIPQNLLESELFGHTKGAFSGAIADKPGKIELANGGDLFLDEIGELAPDLQVKLLRVLETGEFSRVGCNTVRFSKFRIISATHRSLGDMVVQEKFREDLMFRINGMSIFTAPLRDRREDISDLITHFLQIQEGPRFSISTEAITYLTNQPWPGNARELKSRIDCGIAFAKARESTELGLKDLSAQKNFQNNSKNNLMARNNLSAQNFPGLRTGFQFIEQEYQRYLEETEKQYLLAALASYDWDLMQVSHRLGLHLSTLYRRMGQLDIPRTRTKLLGGLHA